MEYKIEMDDMPLCPYCDQPMMEYDETIIIVKHGVQGLAHKFCFDEFECEGGDDNTEV